MTRQLLCGELRWAYVHATLSTPAHRLAKSRDLSSEWLDELRRCITCHQLLCLSAEDATVFEHLSPQPKPRKTSAVYGFSVAAALLIPQRSLKLRLGRGVRRTTSVRQRLLQRDGPGIYILQKLRPTLQILHQGSDPPGQVQAWL